MKRFFSYLIPISICFILGFVASQLQEDAIQNWYPYLNKPPLTPPNILFPIAWGIIYLLSGISAGLIWNNAKQKRTEILTLWGVQQFFNFTWSIMFFALRNPLLGLINIVILDILVLLYITRSWHANRMASILFWPYIVWILFATYLNGYIMLYN
ncbi:MAG: tryptophan-rich sensory protein [Bacteroides sp.]|nr:tryptophan-rich sensory protein [Bacteroides sp.]